MQKRLGVEIVIPAKAEKGTTNLWKKLGEGDEITSIKTPKSRSKWLDVNEKPGKILVRKIKCKSPEGADYVLLTTIY